MERKIKVLLTKSRQDAHDRGMRTIATALRNAGMEVILTRYATPDEIIAVALEEDVDVIGISSFALGHMYDASRVIELMKEKKMTNTLFIMGGIIPDDDVPQLLSIGVSKVSGSGTLPQEVADYILAEKGGAKS
jgi:methylmalonyl-CoA mutase C-terminal domain/subunit